MFYIVVILLLLSSCSNNNAVDKSKEKKNDTSVPPLTVLITNPILVNTDTCPLPQIIVIPKKIGNETITLKNNKKLKLLPPEIFFSDSILAKGNCNFTTYTSDNGLALDAISYGHKSAICDHHGNLWFGTQGGGVSRYDGKSFMNFTTAQGLTDNIVFSITEDKKGNLWFGTAGGGVSRYDGNFFINFTSTQGLADNSIYSSIEDKDGNLWFGTYGGGVSRYDGKSFVNFTTAQGLANNRVYSIIEDVRGDLWFGTDGGISRYNGKSFINYTTTQGLINNHVHSIAQDKNGDLWFGTYGGGVSRYDGKSFMNFNIAQGLTTNIVRSITEDKNGNIWFGTAAGGVIRYDRKSFTTFTTSHGLASNSVYSITEDKNGNLWLGTEGGGLSRYDGKAFVNYTTAQKLTKNIVFSITEDKKNNLWFATAGDGVSRYDGKSFMNFTTAQGLPENTVFSITEDKKGDLWFGTYGGGVSRYDGKSFVNFTTKQGLANNIVRCIIEDKNGNLWFGTYGGGVSRYDGKSFMNLTTAQGLVNNMVFCATEDKNGNLWFGTQGGGVSRYDGKSFVNFTTYQGLASNNICSITEDKNGNLWFGAYGGGVSRYDGKSFMNFTTAQGLPDNSVTQIVITKEQNIAIGTNLGISVLTSFTSKLTHTHKQSNLTAQNNLNNEELKNYIPVLEIYNSATGYPVKDVNSGQNCMFLDSKGIIWAGTGSDKTALVRFDYTALNKNNKPPAVFIQAVKINNENICWHDLYEDKLQTENRNSDSSITPANITEEVSTLGKILSETERDSLKLKFGSIQFDSITRFYPLPQNLILPYDHNNVTIDFAAIEPDRPYLVNYQYMLEGYDKEWSPVLKKNSATFGNISEGTYTFKLKAQSPFGVWSEPVEYTFKVRPPWFRTWWMYSIYVLAFVSSIWSFIKLREKKLKKEKEILETKVEQRTNQLLKANEEITEQKKVVEEKNKDITDSINYALRIQKAILPDKEDIYSSLLQSFILFKPKDIVSGDFYFFHKNNDFVFIASADCTGHGVPGAFMSMVGSERLTDAVQQSNDVSKILSLLNIGVKQSLHQSDKDESTRDGMDIALCSVDLKNRIVRYAGANRPIWIIRKAHTTVEEIKATKKAIGGLTEDSQHFDTHEIKFEQGDTFYISTDGYADTFGGQSKKKLTTKRFKELLLSIQHKSLQEQEVYLNGFIEDWKAGTDQVDDILVIGIQL